ncbi:MAG TPA: DNA-binding protein [Geobacteraceae bacterium]|nr:DNA-binding protein [Geobacteraceae bacterium]
MKKNRFGAMLIAVVMVSTAVSVSAAPGKGGPGSGGWGMGGAYQRTYNPATVETVSGEVISVDQITPMKGMGAGIHLQLKTDKETISVHLGPAWFIDRLDTRVEKGDKIDVKGSRVTVAGKPAIIAAEVKKGDALLKLRDESGVPVWAGWRR